MRELLATKLFINYLDFLFFFQEYEDGHLENRLVQIYFILVLDVFSEQINTICLFFLLFQCPVFVQVVLLKWNHQAFWDFQIGQLY